MENKIKIKRDPSVAQVKLDEALANLGIKPDTKKVKKKKEKR